MPQLKNLGYSLIDALDYSEEMMSEAKKKSVYKRLFLEKVTKSNRLPLKDGMSSSDQIALFFLERQLRAYVNGQTTGEH